MLWLFSCFSDPDPEVELTFVRDGILVFDVDAETFKGGKRLGDSVFYSADWKPGEPYELKGAQSPAPKNPECRSVYSHKLGDVSQMISLGAGPPNTSVSWSKSGDLLAVGAQSGELMIFDGWSGELLKSKKLADGVVKHIAWGADDGSIYIAEQSPKAYLRALTPNLEELWNIELSDYIEGSFLPDKSDIYGFYSLPSAYGLSVLNNTNILVAAAHAWRKDGVFKNRSQLLLISSQGQIVRKYPQEAAHTIFKHPVLNEAQDRVLFSSMCSACSAGEIPKFGPQDGAILLDLSSFEIQHHFSIEPLKPHFNKAQIWKALSQVGDRILIGYNDGRIQLSKTDGSDVSILSTGAPILAGTAPIHALVSWGSLSQEGGFFTTSPTYIPYGAAAPDLRPPSVHPRASSLISIDHSGTELWSWQGELNIQGMLHQQSRSEVLIGSGDRISDRRRDLYGVYIFDAGSGSEQGLNRLVSKCLTPYPVSFNFDQTEDGRIAVIEHPYLDSDGGLKGEYQLRVFR